MLHHPARLFFATVLGISLLAGCSSTQVLEESLDRSPAVTRLDGSIVKIVKVKQGASWGSECGGALVRGALGSVVGGGAGKSIAIGAVAVAGTGTKVADHALGDTVHRLTLKETKTGLTFDVIAHSNGFLMNDKVAFTVEGGHVTSLIHEALLAER